MKPIRLFLMLLLSFALFACNEDDPTPAPSASNAVKKGSTIEYIVVGPDSTTTVNQVSGVTVRHASIQIVQLLDKDEANYNMTHTTPNKVTRSFKAVKDGQKLMLNIWPSPNTTTTSSGTTTVCPSIIVKILVDGVVVKEEQSKDNTQYIKLSYE
jgi:hypothetical protein